MSVTVVGSLNEDVLVRVSRLPGRGETVVGREIVLAPGGKGANQAAAAGRLGNGVAMVGRVGADPAAERQLAALSAAGVDVAHVHRTPGAPTGTATIPVEDGSGENLIVVVPGANAELRPEDVDVAAVHRARVVLLQLEVPLATVQAAAAAAGGTVVLTPAPPQPLPAGLLARVDVLVPNEHELLQLAGAAPGERTPGELARLARTLTARTVVVTLGARGALLVPDDGPALLQPPPAVESVDTTGAGDAFCGALATALAAGTARAEAVATAVTAAALSTTGPGARGALPDAAAVAGARPSLPPTVPVDGWLTGRPSGHEPDQPTNEENPR
ncbi:ribokinase [Geodermatophilus sp. DF01-2]|uniref:ribokinase n=1 Tax=Geodermatophilus sp. DF01-2 TaxID=2559610 RepID=UPI0010732FC3|nr:ribokinase [Geodermatophilus sp. DF01_2]TFV54595.1 ribokinase [Geodermatophilus sp. DF01_2]